MEETSNKEIFWIFCFFWWKNKSFEKILIFNNSLSTLSFRVFWIIFNYFCFVLSFGSKCISQLCFLFGQYYSQHTHVNKPTSACVHLDSKTKKYFDFLNCHYSGVVFYFLSICVRLNEKSIKTKRKGKKNYLKRIHYYHSGCFMCIPKGNFLNDSWSSFILLFIEIACGTSIVI